MKRTTRVLVLIFFTISVIFLGSNLLIVELKRKFHKNNDIQKVNIKVVVNVSPEVQENSL